MIRTFDDLCASMNTDAFRALRLSSRAIYGHVAICWILKRPIGSSKRIAADTGISLRTVIDAVKYLRAKGILVNAASVSGEGVQWVYRVQKLH